MFYVIWIFLVEIFILIVYRMVIINGLFKIRLMLFVVLSILFNIVEVISFDDFFLLKNIIFLCYFGYISLKVIIIRYG